METLYISYDGMLEPLGQSQVVNYLLGLAHVHSQTLISFEKPRDLKELARVAQLEATLRGAGIKWIRLKYHKWPSTVATMWDVIRGCMMGLYVCVSRRVGLVHARGYVPALIASFLKQIAGPKFLFDMRGFWADEKVDGGSWSNNSWIYKVTKRCEKKFFESADALVSLTSEGVKAIPDLGYTLAPDLPIKVIPTCTDLDSFKPGAKNQALLTKLGLEESRVIGCVGTMSNWYLRQPMLEYLAYLTNQIDRSKVLIVTREDHEQIKKEAIEAGVEGARLVIVQTEFHDVPDYIRMMDVGMFFIRVCFSKRGSAATKLGEFLGCGVPVVINDGIGDSGWIVRKHNVGVVLSGTTRQDFDRSLQPVVRMWNDPAVSIRCREVAAQYFDLRAGIAQYASLYRDLAVGDAR